MHMLQTQVMAWMHQAFEGIVDYMNLTQRCDRFIEECLELVQACGYDLSRVAALVQYVSNRPKGEVPQEVGGVMITLAALIGVCNKALPEDHEINIANEADREMRRIRTPEVMAKIRAKQADKTRDIPFSPLPQRTRGVGMASTVMKTQLVEALNRDTGYSTNMRTPHMDALLREWAETFMSNAPPIPNAAPLAIESTDDSALKRLEETLRRCAQAKTTFAMFHVETAACEPMADVIAGIKRLPERIVLLSRGVTPHWYFIAKKAGHDPVFDLPMYETLDAIVPARMLVVAK
jgi:hypothetical protein